ncbi:MAG: ribosome biogenesis GTPase Der [Gammaproteobacteria bacterium]|nr:ribosome biogenesis GTPase Der [Gammaproteobacteria bacterium]
MLPVVVLVGRPNVGKSTLFNRLTGTRDAIVADLPGVTRDRQYGYGKLGPVPYVVVDTGGLVEQPSGIETPMRLQTERAVEEADVLVFLADARSGLTPQDHWVVRELRRSGKKVVLAVNKAEGLDPATAAADFHSLGLGEPMAIASAHGDGCRELMSRVLEDFDPEVIAAESAPNDGRIRIAIIGRPNVGKSTLVNRLIGEERVIASDMPGTTRDSIFVPFARDEREFTLIDTAGVRRRGKIEDDIEKASVAKTLQAIDTAHVVIFVVDAHDSIGEQDANVLGLALQRGRALIIAVNKWDGIPMEQRDEIRRLLELKLDFVPYAPVHFISARHGTGVGELVAATIKAYDAAMSEIPTSKLTKSLERAMVQHQPPLVRGRRIKLRYAHQGGRNPPRIIIHGNQTVHVPEAYTRYLANVFRREFDLFASPVAVEYRTDSNPYARTRGRPRPQTASEKRALAKEKAQRARKSR